MPPKEDPEEELLCGGLYEEEPLQCPGPLSIRLVFVDVRCLYCEYYPRVESWRRAIPSEYYWERREFIL
ncbi:hypothetical protein MMC09_000820, partial [Bachmanniomyces sp. S44760]|nr:hypothetical protein [Bachmanniomyces sp. S44760]